MGMNVVETPATAANGSSVNGKKKPDQERNWRQLESERDTLPQVGQRMRRGRGMHCSGRTVNSRENNGCCHRTTGFAGNFRQA